MKGVGIWGIDVPVMWGFAIVNFVWWIGIGHAGTLISAILLLLKQDWRTSINRFAEAMTLFAVACAGLFPLLHLGRPWFFYWLLPYPNTMGLWPQWRSPLVWDVFAVSTYATVSLLFWYVGLIPDLATLARPGQEPVRPDLLRDAWRWAGAARPGTGTATGRPTCCWPGWRRRWSSRSTRSSRSTSPSAIVPGWHSTIFPPYFVAGAIFSGFAMVADPLHPACAPPSACRTSSPTRHLDNMAKVMLATGLIVAYGYLMETFMAWYSRNPYEEYRDAPESAVRRLCSYVLDDDDLQRVRAPAPLVPRGPAQILRSSGSSRSSSTSACGSSGT